MQMATASNLGDSFRIPKKNFKENGEELQEQASLENSGRREKKSHSEASPKEDRERKRHRKASQWDVRKLPWEQTERGMIYFPTEYCCR